MWWPGPARARPHAEPGIGGREAERNVPGNGMVARVLLRSDIRLPRMPMVHESATVSLLRRRRLWLGALGAATVVALLFAAEQYLFRSALDQPGRIPMLVVSQLARWFLWL